MTHRGRSSIGFTLIEVLVGVMITSVGLLGLGVLLSSSLQSNHAAYLHTQASQLARSMADQMRKNLDGVGSGHYDSFGGPESGAQQSCMSSTGGCTTSHQVALHDQYIWRTRLAESLPNGLGYVAGNGGVFEITVLWDDERTGATGIECSGDTTVDLTCHSMSVRIGL